MAAGVLEKPPEVKVSDATAFGSHGNAAAVTNGVPVEQKTSDQAPREVHLKPFAKNEPLEPVSAEGQIADPWLRDIGITTTSPEIEKRIWSPHFEHYFKTRKWLETYHGRVAIRSISRGIVGTMFFAGMQMYANHSFSTNVGGIEYDGTKDTIKRNPLRAIAWAIDKTIGRGIETVFRSKSAVTFRPTANFGYSHDSKKPIMGRSLGHDIVAVTADFAAMSFGDFMTRYAISLFDPNTTTRWIKRTKTDDPNDQEFQGHLDILGGLREVIQKVFTGITYASGEDMAVALPYVYFLRWQRNVLDKFSPGFGLDSDAGGAFGASYKMRNGKIVGDYNLESVVDFVGRFSIYNVLTRIFRDTYNKFEILEKFEAFQDKVGALFGLKEEGGDEPKKLSPPKKGPKKPFNLLRTIDNFGMYMFTTFTRTMFYMIPASFVFGILRVPMGKPNARVIDVGALEAGADPRTAIQTLAAFKPRFDPTRFDSTRNKEFTDNLFNKNIYDGANAPWYSGFMNWVGKATYGLAGGYNKAFDAAAQRTRLFRTGAGANAPAAPTTATNIASGFAYRWAGAQIPYTPYFMFKTDLFSQYLDTSRSTIALEELYHGLTRFNGKQIRKGWGDVLHAITKQPFEDRKLEERTEEAMVNDVIRRSNEANDVLYGDRKTATGFRPFAQGSGHRQSKIPPQRHTYVQLHADPAVVAKANVPETDKVAEAETELRNRQVPAESEGSEWRLPHQRPREPIMPKSLMDRATEEPQPLTPGRA